jgi:hypothetical protein
MQNECCSVVLVDVSNEFGFRNAARLGFALCIPAAVVQPVSFQQQSMYSNVISVCYSTYVQRHLYDISDIPKSPMN